MKKIIPFIALFIALFTNAQSNDNVELLPEMSALITPKPLDPKRLEDNLFIALMGAKYPHHDYYEVAQKAVSESYENILKALPDNDYIADDEMGRILEKYYQQINTKDNWQWQGNWQEQKVIFPVANT